MTRREVKHRLGNQEPKVYPVAHGTEPATCAGPEASAQVSRSHHAHSRRARCSFVVLPSSGRDFVLFPGHGWRWECVQPW